MVKETAGGLCHPGLASILASIGVVEIFGQSQEVSPILKEAIEIGAQAVWTQGGVRNEEVGAQAREAGLLAVIDECIFKEHQKLKRQN